MKIRNPQRFLGSQLLILLIVFIIGIAAGRAVAAGVSADATWWGDVQSDARADVVHAAIDAYQSGWARGSDAEGARIIDDVRDAVSAKLLPQAALEAVTAIVYKKTSSGHFVSYEGAPEFTKTFGAYDALIDDFYVRHTSASSATIGDIMTCLADKPVFTCEQIAKFSTP